MRVFLGVLVVVGSRNLERFDAALVAYTFATLFAVFGLTLRYAIWLQRPSTALYWKRGWQLFFRRKHLLRNSGVWLRRVTGEFAANDFIWRRGRLRGLTHMLLMWGCIIAGAITFPLVFGWLSFESIPGRMAWYRVYVFGFPTLSFPHESIVAFLVFHGLVWASFLVIAGVMLAMRRRMRDEGAAALQLFAEDFLPLILLFAVSVTGLLLTASYTWMKGYGYDFLAILHAVTVIFTLLWLPFGKFFHIFQRPAQLGGELLQGRGRTRGKAERCARAAGQDALLLLRPAVRHPAQGEGQRGHRLRAVGGVPVQPGDALPQGRQALPAGLAPGSAADGAAARPVRAGGLQPDGLRRGDRARRRRDRAHPEAARQRRLRRPQRARA